MFEEGKIIFSKGFWFMSKSKLGLTAFRLYLFDTSSLDKVGRVMFSRALHGRKGYEGLIDIDKLGAYVRPLDRGKGIGTALLERVINWCSEHGVNRIHVDYESANLYANSFWPKYFASTMYTVKRRVNPDMR